MEGSEDLGQLLDEVRGLPCTTVPIGGRLVGLSRPAAYEAARRYLATGGREGLPVLRFGKRLVVPVPRLLALLGAEVGADPQSEGILEGAASDG